MKTALSLPIENFGDMQERYKMLPLASRAKIVLSDVKPALDTAYNILDNLNKNPKISQAVEALRGNSLIISRIRGSEAKTALSDNSVNFINESSRKLTIWYKTVESIAKGEVKAALIGEAVPERLAIASGSSYLALVKMIIPELIKIDKGNKADYDIMFSDLRRCMTVISDCECASELNSVVLH